MVELIAAVIPIHGLLAFLIDVNRFLDPPAGGGTVWLSLLPVTSRSHGSL